jgi:general secretion pathway protein A
MGNIAGIARTSIGSSESPFGTAPSAGRFYGTAQYEENCNRILNGIRERRGLIVVTGEPGTGKTTIVQQAVDRLDKSNCSVLFCSFHPALDETLNSLCQHLGLSIADQEQQQKIQQLNQTLFARFRMGKSTAFVVDDAHNLDPRTVAQILSLADQTLTGEPLLQVVLVGLPELGPRLRSAVCHPPLPSAYPNIEVRKLPPAEVAPFIEHQLKAVAPESRGSFTLAAMGRIAVYSKGIPREINALCGLASVIANLESSPVVTEEMVEEVKGERALWGVGIEAQTAAATAGVPKTQVPHAPEMPWTSVHPTVYPPKPELEAVNDGDGGGTGEQQTTDLSPPWAGDDDVIALGATPASPTASIRAEGSPTQRGVATQRGWWPSWWLTGSTLAFSAFLVASLALWHELPFSGGSARLKATGQTESRLAQDNPEAEIEFAQMRPVITRETAEPRPSLAAPGVVIPPSSLPAITPRSVDDASPAATAQQPTLAPDSMARASAAAEAPDSKTKQQPTMAKVQENEKESDIPVQTASQPKVALSRPETANTPQQAPGSASVPATEAVTEPTAEGTEDQAIATPASAKPSQPPTPAPVAAVGPRVTATTVPIATPPSREQSLDSNASKTDETTPAKPVGRTEPDMSVAKLDRAPDAGATKPAISAPEAKVPAILGAVDRKVYKDVENRSLDQITGEILADAAEGGDSVAQLRRYLREAPSVNVESAISASSTLGASSAPSVTPSVGVTGARLF